MDGDEISIHLCDVIFFGEQMQVAYMLVTDIHDHAHEVTLLAESAEALRDALTAALDGAVAR